jgi:carbon-monoxide dehydrogenase large subunit
MPVREGNAKTSWIGRPLRAREDVRYLRGQARYVDDVVLPGMASLVVVRSPFAHARIRSVDTGPARRCAGVLAVITAGDLVGRLGPMPVNVQEGAWVAPVPHPVLAGEKVRYVGEPVAAVVAESREAALDAAERVAVEYDPLPAVVDPRDALSGSVLVHETLGDNVILRWSRAHGEVGEAFQRAARIVEGRFHIPRVVAAPMEPRGAVASYDPGTDVVTVWCSAQDPHRPLAQLASVLRRPEDRLRIIVPDVGGAFGSKGTVGPEVAVAAVAAMDLGRPVKWVETRRENFLASYQGRGLDAHVELAVGADGRINALRARLVADLGAYLYPATAIVPVTAAMLMTGAYAIPAAEVELVGVATTKVPTGPYRGAGRPEAAYVVERMMDLLARELGRDPVEVRRRNLIPADRFPYRTPLGFVYDSGDYARALERALDLADYGRWRDEQRRARAAGRLVGIGVSVYVERAGSGLWEASSVSVDPQGRVVVRMGSTPHGQAHETTFAQIAADRLGISPDEVVVLHGDSAVVPRGVGTFGSRSTTVGGSALVVALEKILEKMTRIASHLLEAAPEDIVRDGSRFAVRGAPSRSVAFQEVAAAAYVPPRLPRGMEPGLAATGSFALPGPVFPSGAYVAVVEVLRDTGEVRILRFVAVDDAGRVVNPFLAEAQVMGGIVQGLGEVFLEEAVYDEGGQLVTATFTDYALPRAVHAPPLVSAFVETPSPSNPLGAKGIGEAGTIATPPAVVNAVVDALAPLGVRHVDLPLTQEKLWRIVGGEASPRAAREGGGPA